MSSFSTSSDEKLKETIHSFYQALARNDLEALLEVCTGDVTLSWGSYQFVGREKVNHWFVELRELFPFLAFMERSLQVQGNVVKQEFAFSIVMVAGHKGWLPCTGLYEFKDG